MDRTSIRARPEGPPVMRQSWGKLLFLHWRIPAEDLRALVPERLSLDTFEGSAWVGVVPFTMWDIRPPFLPGLPILGRSHELNVRTYVHLDGVPGVWFLSLDASSPLVVLGARLTFALPYFRARMRLEQRGEAIHYHSIRADHRGPAARFEARWRIGEPLPQPEPGSLAFFLTERYCLYARRGDGLYRARILHRPWPLRRAELGEWSSTMLAAHGLERPDAPPLLHYAERLDVEVWRPRRV